MQTEDPCIFLQGTQTDHPTVDTSIQIDVEKYVRVDCIIQEEFEVAVATDPREAQDREAQTDETPLYTPLEREVVIKKLQNELLMVPHELAQHKEKVVPST